MLSITYISRVFWVRGTLGGTKAKSVVVAPMFLMNGHWIDEALVQH